MSHLEPGTDVWCEICFRAWGVPYLALTVAQLVTCFHPEGECPHLADLYVLP